MSVDRQALNGGAASRGRRDIVTALALAPILPLLSACARPEAPSLSDKPTNVIFLETDEERAVLPQGEELRRLHDKGLALTKASEGWVNHLYNDAAGYCTVGYGHLCYRKRCDGQSPREYLKGLAEAAGSDLLRGDMQKAQIAVQLAIPNHRQLLNDFQYAALCDFVFNAGAANFRSSTLLKVVLDQQLDRVPAQFRRWILAGGKKFKGLEIRREGEIALFFEGQPVPRSMPRADEDLSPLDIRPI
jgi:GH24 family phage-related lysozyme (muramidase)